MNENTSTGASASNAVRRPMRPNILRSCASSSAPAMSTIGDERRRVADSTDGTCRAADVGELRLIERER